MGYCLNTMRGKLARFTTYSVVRVEGTKKREKGKWRRRVGEDV